MKKLLLFWLLFLHSTTTVHFAQANIFTETISSTASLLFSAKVLIPVTLGTALFFSLVRSDRLHEKNRRLRRQNSLYYESLHFHGIELKCDRFGVCTPVDNKQTQGGKFKILCDEYEAENRKLRAQVTVLQAQLDFINNKK